MSRLAILWQLLSNPCTEGSAHSPQIQKHLLLLTITLSKPPCRGIHFDPSILSHLTRHLQSVVQSRAGPKFPQQKHSSVPMFASTQLKPQSNSGIRYQQQIKAVYVCWYIPQTHWTKRRDWLRMHDSCSPSSLYFNSCLLTSWLLWRWFCLWLKDQLWPAAIQLTTMEKCKAILATFIRLYKMLTMDTRNMIHNTAEPLFPNLTCLCTSLAKRMGTSLDALILVWHTNHLAVSDVLMLCS